MKGLQNYIYLIAAAGMLIFAVPQLRMGHGFKLETIFAVTWLGLALTVIAAHLYVLIRVDQEVGVEVKALKQVQHSDF
jgi:cytochrome oxidase assembly protein ShyY1